MSAMVIKWKPISSAEFDRAAKDYADLERAGHQLTADRRTPYGPHAIETVYRVNGMPALRRMTYMCASDRKRVATRRHWMSRWYEMNRAGLLAAVFL